MKKIQAHSSPMSPINITEDVEIEPLLGKPYFHVHICKSHVSNPYQLTVGSAVTRLLPRKNISVTLTRGRRKWEATDIGTHPTHKSFDFPSWKVFAADNTIKVGDVRLFELQTCTETHILFKVQVLRGEFPSKFITTKK